MQTWETHDGAVASVAFAPDGLRLVAAGRTTLRVGPVCDSWPAVVINHRCFRRTAFTPDGMRIIADGEEADRVFAWDPDTGRATELARPNGHSWVFAFDPVGRLAVYSNVDFLSNDLQWYSFATGGWVDLWADLSPSGGYALAFSPDGRHLALPSAEQLTVWDLTRRVLVASADLPGGSDALLTYAPDGRWLVFGAGRRLAVAAAPALTPAAELRGGRAYFTAVAFHPSGRFFAATSNDATVKLYDTDTWQVAKTYSWEIGKLRSVAFSPDGTLAAAGSDTGKIVVWDVDV